MTWIVFKTYVEFYYAAAWHACADVLADPGVSWEYGLPGGGVNDLVAGTGILYFTLDNSEANSAHLAGYYTPGHTNAPAWFVDGLPVRVRLERQDDMTIATRFLGYLVSCLPSSGMYRNARTQVEARDWLDYAYEQHLGAIPIDTGAGLGVEDALTTALTYFDIQPAATDFDTGKETFAALFDSDNSEEMTMSALFQKLARNEGGGFIFLEGDGTLRFDNRHARILATADAFTLDATASSPMQELDVTWDRGQIVNRIEVTIYPADVDTGSTTIIWQLREPFILAPGQVMAVTCAFVDPDTGTRISASDVVNPLVSGTTIKFGSANDGTSNDLIGSLTFPMVVGGNTAIVTLTNIGTQAGYLNLLKILGNGIYRYEPLVIANEDAASIALRGVRPLTVDLEQVTSANTANLYGAYLLGQLKDPSPRPDLIRFLANFSDEFATAALTIEPNTRFRVKEYQTGLDAPVFACRILFRAQGQFVWVDIVPAMMPGGGEINYFIWDVAGHGWDEGVWVF